MPRRGEIASECAHGHAFTGDNLFISQGKQRCRECHRRAGRERTQRLAALRTPKPIRPAVCTLDGCERPRRSALDLCHAHARRVRLYGDPMRAQVYREDPRLRFWSKVDRDGPVPTYRPELGPCWIWTGAANDKGYGSIFWNGRTQAAHRVSLELAGTPVAAGYHSDHLCRVHPCVRPTHLEAVVPAENVRRGDADYRARWTHCSKGHAFDEANTHRNRAGKRVCRACSRKRVADRKATARA